MERIKEVFLKDINIVGLKPTYKHKTDFATSVHKGHYILPPVLLPFYRRVRHLCVTQTPSVFPRSTEVYWLRISTTNLTSYNTTNLSTV